MYSPNSKHSKSGIHGGERSKVFDINSHQLHSHWPPGSHLPRWLAPLNTNASSLLNAWLHERPRHPCSITLNLDTIHWPCHHNDEQGWDGKSRAIFKWVCRISILGGNTANQYMNIILQYILNVWWYQCGLWVWGTFSIKYGFHSRCCRFCRCYVTLCATSDAYSRLVFDQIHQIRKYFTLEINLTARGWYLQIICTRSVWSNQPPTSPITLYSIKEESVLSL